MKAVVGMALMAAAAAVAAGGAVAQPAAATADDLGWLSGRWESVDGERWTEEVWSAPRGGLLIGYSRSGSGVALREFAFLRIAPGEDGVPVYLASPGGRPAVPFRLVSRDGTSATFANPAHDFPQRIAYRRAGETMVATISTSDGGDAMSWTYRLRSGGE
ncbi:MAG: DUF6265 family protein [Allosphingosinicella sp.]